jgi:CDP-diacylglycerol--glycerol-3-phosphate 3-phosphatidyltransferase
MWAWGIAADLDVILIMLLLPRWEHDIASAWHALRLRRGLPIRRGGLFN